MSATAFQRMRREQAAKEASQKDQGNNEELQQLRLQAKELGIANASKLGIKKLTEAIEAAVREKESKQAEQEKLLQEVREKSIQLGIESVEEKDYETLISEIAALEG